jgi:phospholipid transport system transporter-binding protein
MSRRGTRLARPEPMPVEFEDCGGGCFRLRGELSFPTVVAALERSKALFADHSVIELDLGGVSRADSAGLALLLEWVNWARSTAREIRFRNIPEQIRAMAQISEVEDMLNRAERWTGS